MSPKSKACKVILNIAYQALLSIIAIKNFILC